MFFTLHLTGCLSPFHLVLFLEFCSVLSFGPFFFVSSLWQPLCVCVCVLGRAAWTPCLSSVAYCRKVHPLSCMGWSLRSLLGRSNPHHRSVAPRGGGLSEGTVPLPGLWRFAREEVVSWYPHFTFSPCTTGALPAVVLMLNLRGAGLRES